MKNGVLEQKNMYSMHTDQELYKIALEHVKKHHQPNTKISGRIDLELQTIYYNAIMYVTTDVTTSYARHQKVVVFQELYKQDLDEDKKVSLNNYLLKKEK